MTAVRHLGFVVREIGPPTKGVWWTLYQCAKFGSNRSSSFDNIYVLAFCEFGFKTPIDAHFGVFWGTFPQMMSLIVLTPKRPSLGGTTSFEPYSMNIGRAVRAWRWNEKKDST